MDKLYFSSVHYMSLSLSDPKRHTVNTCSDPKGGSDDGGHFKSVHHRFHMWEVIFLDCSDLFHYMCVFREMMMQSMTSL